MKVLDRPMSLTREEVLAVLDRHAQELRRLGAKSLALFGSVARGEGTASSDIDLLVELEPKTFDAYMDVKLFLEKVLGRRVDLVLADAVKPRLRSVILAEAVHASGL
jgi:predicted nucleotidyltransferase